MLFKKNESIEFTNEIMTKRRIPILIYDQQWRKIFSGNKNKSMEILSKELQQLLSDEKQLQQNLKSSLERKRVLMNKIIHLSDRLNIKGEEIDVSNMGDAKDKINRINEEIDKIREDLEVYPKKIENLNIELLKETIKVAYSEINNTRSRLMSVDEEINILREKLGEYREEKETLEENEQVLYSLLHSVIGPDDIEKLDVKFFPK